MKVTAPHMPSAVASCPCEIMNLTVLCSCFKAKRSVGDEPTINPCRSLGARCRAARVPVLVRFVPRLPPRSEPLDDTD